MDGAVWLGPNAVLAFAREGYRRRDVDVQDVAEILRYRGFSTLARRYWRVGVDEMYRDFWKAAFLKALSTKQDESTKALIGQLRHPS